MSKTIQDEIAAVPQRADHDNDKSYVIKLMNCVSASQVQANACRLKIGLDLLAAPDCPAKRAGRTEWQAAKAAQLEIGPRHLRTIISAAEGYLAMVKANCGTSADGRTLNRPMSELKRAFSNLATGKPVDAHPPKGVAKPTTVEGIAMKLGTVMALFELLPDSDLDDAFDALADELEKVLPGWGREVRGARLAVVNAAAWSAEEGKPRGGGVSRAALAIAGTRMCIAGDHAAELSYPTTALQ